MTISASVWFHLFVRFLLNALDDLLVLDLLVLLVLLQVLGTFARTCNLVSPQVRGVVERTRTLAALVMNALVLLFVTSQRRVRTKTKPFTKRNRIFLAPLSVRIVVPLVRLFTSYAPNFSCDRFCA